MLRLTKYDIYAIIKSECIITVGGQHDAAPISRHIFKKKVFILSATAI